MPSILIAISITFLTLGSSSYILRRSGLMFKAFSRVILSSNGIAFAILSASAYVRLSALPTSLTAAFALSLPKVMIWETFSLPYFCLTYSITSPRLSIQKSISISGMLTRSGFRNRSKIKVYLVGSISVIFRQYETRLPAAEPLPGPTAILLFLA